MCFFSWSVVQLVSWPMAYSRWPMARVGQGRGVHLSELSRANGQQPVANGQGHRNPVSGRFARMRKCCKVLYISCLYGGGKEILSVCHAGQAAGGLAVCRSGRDHSLQGIRRCKYREGFWKMQVFTINRTILKILGIFY